MVLSLYLSVTVVLVRHRPRLFVKMFPLPPLSLRPLPPTPVSFFFACASTTKRYGGTYDGKRQLAILFTFLDGKDTQPVAAISKLIASADNATVREIK